MKAREFPERTHYIEAKGRPRVAIHKAEGKNGMVILSIGLNFKERIRVLFLGRIWVAHMTYKKPLQPTSYTTRRLDLFLPISRRHRIAQYINSFFGK